MYEHPRIRDKTTRERLLAAIRLCASLNKACAFAGLHPETFRRWRRKAEAEIRRREDPAETPDPEMEPYVELYQEVEQAEGEATVAMLGQIEKAALNGNWQAAAWKLERRFPDEYSRRIVQIQGDADGGPVKHQHSWEQIIYASAQLDDGENDESLGEAGRTRLPGEVSDPS